MRGERSAERCCVRRCLGAWRPSPLSGATKRSLRDDATAPAPQEPQATDDGGSDGPGVLVRSADGSTERGALHVGADGASSRVRARLAPQIQLRDCDLQMIFGKTPLTPAFLAALGASGCDDVRVAEPLAGLTLLDHPSPQESPMVFISEPMRFVGRASAAAADPVIAASIPGDYIC